MSPPKRPASPPSPAAVFLLLLPLRLLAALASPPSDCDEVFNYWEPLHFLHRGTGLQTWEYSPAFALRSYAFLLPFLAAARAALPLPFSATLRPFYAVRLSLAALSALADAHLHASFAAAFTPAVSAPFLLALLSAPGIFRASVELLPSTVALHLLTLAFSFWLRRRFRPAVFLVALASLLAWVFAAALAAPLALHLLLSPRGLPRFLAAAVPSGLAVLAVMVPLDSYFFGALTVAPLNHLLYNVFPPAGAGSHIFGVEGPAFYPLNLALNCHLAAVFFAIFPVVLLAALATGVYTVRDPRFARRLTFLSPPFLYLAILAAQPHKEERFLVPAYTCIAMVAAVSFADLVAVSERLTRALPAPVTRAVKAVACVALAALCVALGASRTAMQVRSFGAPVRVYTHLSDVELQRGIGPRAAPPQFMAPARPVNVCVGKEWYRFPGSYFLPGRRFRIRFVRAGFTGLMPKPFDEGGNGTSVVPPGMNAYNEEDPAQFYDWEREEGCHYFVDLDLSHRHPDGADQAHEAKHPVPIRPEAKKIVYSEPFLDSEASSAGYRAFYMPGFEHKLVYGQYQLIRNLDLLPIIE